MRYFQIFSLHIQQVLQQRSYMLVYFLMSLVNPLIFVLFWQGVTQGGKSILPGWNFSTITSYYFYFTILNGLLMANPEYTVARQHIKEGDLVRYLLKPLPYFLQVFFMEFSWRFIRFWFGIITITIFYLFWHNAIIGIRNDLTTWILVLVVCFLGFMVSFVMKMILGISAFWVVETRGLFDLMQVLVTIFAGFVVPLALLPSGITSLALALPFSYIIYFPVLVLEGKIPFTGILHIIMMQLMWIGTLYFFYHLLWRKGLQKFSAVGQ